MKVQGEGPLSARIAFVGEAPGAEEAARGRPFVGAAGAAFDRFLADVGIRRADCYITNVVKERPPNNDISYFLKRGHNGSVKTTPLYDEYERRLYEELGRCEANVIVPMGNTALWAVARLWGIEKWRGSIVRAVPELAFRKTLPTYHPAYTLREYLAQVPLKLDLHRIVRESANPDVRLPKRNLRVFPAFNEALDYIGGCRGLKEVGFDIETRRCGDPPTWEMSCFAFAHSANDAMCVPLWGPNGLSWNEDEHVALLEAAASVLENPTIRKVGQNINFDAGFLLRKHGINVWPVHDTMIAERLILSDDKQRKTPILSVGLDFICSIYTDEPYYKDDIKQNLGEPRDWVGFYEYNARDAAVVLEVLPRQLEDLRRLGNLATYERTLRILPQLLFMQERGIRSDEEALARAKAELESDLDALLASLMETVGAKAPDGYTSSKTGKPKQFDRRLPNSPEQCRAYFYGVLRHREYRSRDGRVTTDDEALIRLSRKGCAEAALVLEYRRKSKLVSNYLAARLRDGRFHCQFKPVGTVTGRLSSAIDSFGFGLNLQTLPRTGVVKRLFLPDPNYILFQFDYAQAENRIMAYCGGVTLLRDAFERDIDAYAVTAVHIARRLGASSMTYEQVIEEHANKVPAPVAGSRYTWRGLGKIANLALSYGMGIDRFSRENELPLADAAALHQAWHDTYPEVRGQYHAMINDMLRANRCVVNPFGRVRKFLGRWDDLLEPAYSHFCQSTVADAINERALIFIEESNGLFERLELLLQVHDSIVFQVPADLGPQHIACVCQILKSNMERPIKWRASEFSLPVSVSAGTRSLGELIELGNGGVTAETIDGVLGGG